MSIDPGAETHQLSWDDFLTPRDQAFLATSSWAKVKPFGLGTRPALLVVDDYYKAVGSHRLPLLESIELWPASCGSEGWDAIDRTAVLLDAARSNGIPVAYTRKLQGFEAPTVGGGLRSGTGSRGQTRDNDIVDEIRPRPGDLVIEKISPSAFPGTPLVQWLIFEQIDTLLVCGESTSGCVRATVVDGASHRFRMGVVHDCCFDRLQSSHWVSLHDMHQKYADLLNLEEAVQYLASCKR